MDSDLGAWAGRTRTEPVRMVQKDSCTRRQHVILNFALGEVDRANQGGAGPHGPKGFAHKKSTCYLECTENQRVTLVLELFGRAESETKFRFG